MKEIVIAFLVLWSFAVHAETKTFKLKPDFNGVSQVKFTTESASGYDVLKGTLTNSAGQNYSVPDVCEPEGGVAEISDAYVVDGKARYFLFTCFWSVSHAGIGLKGTQYETYIYTGSSLGSLNKELALGQFFSDYEGSLEDGEHSYAWYVARNIVGKKLLELEAGKTADSLKLAHAIVMARLKNDDYKAVRAYLNHERVKQLSKDSPIVDSNVTVYNDLGFALGESGDFELAYMILSEVESVSPHRVVLKLNIADVLWGTDKVKAISYYKDYAALMREAGKERLIPKRVLERAP